MLGADGCAASFHLAMDQTLIPISLLRSRKISLEKIKVSQLSLCTRDNTLLCYQLNFKNKIFVCWLSLFSITGTQKRVDLGALTQQMSMKRIL